MKHIMYDYPCIKCTHYADSMFMVSVYLSHCVNFISIVSLFLKKKKDENKIKKYFSLLFIFQFLYPIVFIMSHKMCQFTTFTAANSKLAVP